MSRSVKRWGYDANSSTGKQGFALSAGNRWLSSYSCHSNEAAIIAVSLAVPTALHQSAQVNDVMNGEYGKRIGWMANTNPVLAFLTSVAAAEESISFPRHIQPIFAEHCHQCHFRRTPSVEMGQNGTGASQGRDHNHRGFSFWMAGGGVKAGTIFGATDEFGSKAVENRVPIHDLQATILHLLGFDHERLTGRNFRLTDIHGRVVHEILV